MVNPKEIEFNEENIRKLFGTFDGESENLVRLSEYYLKTDTYNEVLANLPVRILVGNKGVGKSALFRIAMEECKSKGDIVVMIKPNDIAAIGEKHESLLLSIRAWKYGLADIIARKALMQMGIYDDTVTGKIIPYGHKIDKVILSCIKQCKDLDELSDSEKALIKRFAKSSRIDVFLDDLDRGWQNRKEDVTMISGLINSIRDLSSENEGLQMKLAIRTDVYMAVRAVDEAGDKYEGSVINYTYSLDEIFVLLIKRILTFSGEPINESRLLNSSQSDIASKLDPVFERDFTGRGAWSNVPMTRVLLSLIRNRPRDLIKLCTMSAREAHKSGSKVIRTHHIEAILPEYSSSLMNDTIGEYRAELPDISRLLYGMKPNRKERTSHDVFYYTSSELNNKIYQIMQSGDFKLSGMYAKPQDLADFLFKISFLTARKDNGSVKIRKTYEEARQLSSAYFNFGFDWEVHLGYRWAIQPESINDLFDRL